MLATTTEMNYIPIPRIARLFAKDILVENNIPYEMLTYDETPEYVPNYCYFRGRSFEFDKIRIIYAAINPDVFLEALDNKVRLNTL